MTNMVLLKQPESPQGRGLLLDGKPVPYIPYDTKVYCIWSPDGFTSPREFFTVESVATARARRLCHLTGQEFYVLGTESVHQKQLRVASFYIGVKPWLGEAIRQTQAYWKRRKLG